MIEKVKPGYELEVDGGIDETTAPLVVDAAGERLGGRFSNLQRWRKYHSGEAANRRAVSKNEDIKH